MHTEMAEREPKKRTNDVAIAKLLDVAHAEEATVSPTFKAKEDLVDGVSTVPIKSIVQQVGTTFVIKFQILRVSKLFCSRARENKTRIGEYGRSSNGLSYEQLGGCAQFLEKCSQECLGPTQNKRHVKGTDLQACEAFFRSPNKATQEKVDASRSDCDHEKSRIYCGKRRVSSECTLTIWMSLSRCWKIHLQYCLWPIMRRNGPILMNGRRSVFIMKKTLTK